MTTTQLVILAVAVLTLCLLALVLPRPILGRRAAAMEITERLAAENAMRAVAFQAVTTLILIVGAGVTIKQLNSTEKATRDQITLTKEAQQGAQFTQAVGQLTTQGSQNLPARLGGVYALTQLAVSAPNYQQSVFDVLTAYVRQAAPRTGANNTAPVGPLSGRDPALQSALTAIGTKLADSFANRVIGLSLDVSDAPTIYLGEADFASGYFARADFKLDGVDGASFRGSDLRGACFLGSSVDGTDFRGADLRGADFRSVDNINSALFDTRTTYDQDTKWPKQFSKLALLRRLSTASKIPPAPCEP